ncbi:GGDEF domain-containing protein [Streptomyces sp. NRRL S-244]|uniref:GGDEF domain-containing protein n=1 Tax=Streptomyces sp. NRRL S-244 TaxID=1463897 RepID=UPI0004C1D673|nr:GGDEF domain-containing protein [Streptomyces sp. NRRL S-244]
MSHTLTALSAALPVAAGWSAHGFRLRRRIDAARRDPLTGLWTRAPFEERARKSLTRGRQRAVYVMDLNWFKQINDRFGHAAGDAVIRATGERLARWAADHAGVAGRLGGDEFAAVTDVCGEADTVTDNLSAKVLDLLHRLEQPVVFDGRPIGVHVSVGAVRYWRDTADLSALLRLADEHMYMAKREGGGASLAPRFPTKPQSETVNGRRAGRRGTATTGTETVA